MNPNLLELDELEWLAATEGEAESAPRFSFDDVPVEVRNLLRARREREAIRSAIRLGDARENHLTDLIFFSRHPERRGRYISRDEPEYAQASQEWLAIRNEQVRTELTPPPAPAAPNRSPSGNRNGTSADLVTLTWSGKTFQVARQIAGQVEDLLEAAAADGIQLVINSAYRDPQEQIALRKKYCGTTEYAIYDMPPSQCRIAVARPGTSNHEKGLAIDFGVRGGKVQPGTPAFEWLSLHAASFGLKNYPKEPWHWSVDGR